MQCFSIKSQNVTKNVAKNDTAKNVAKNNVAKNDIAKNVAIAWLFWGCCWAHHLAISGLLLGVVLGPCLDAFLGLSWPFCWDVGMSEGQKVGTSGFQGCCHAHCLAVLGLVGHSRAVAGCDSRAIAWIVFAILSECWNVGRSERWNVGIPGLLVGHSGAIRLFGCSGTVADCDSRAVAQIVRAILSECWQNVVTWNGLV